MTYRDIAVMTLNQVEHLPQADKVHYVVLAGQSAEYRVAKKVKDSAWNDSKRCPSCEKLLHNRERFCPDCGQHLRWGYPKEIIPYLSL